MQVVSHDVTWLLSHIRVISSELPESAGATPTPAVHVGALTRAVSRSVFVTVTVRTPRCRQLTPIGTVRPLVGMEESRKESRRIGRDCIQMRTAAKLVRDSGWMNDTPSGAGLPNGFGRAVLSRRRNAPTCLRATPHPPSSRRHWADMCADHAGDAQARPRHAQRRHTSQSRARLT